MNPLIGIGVAFGMLVGVRGLLLACQFGLIGLRYGAKQADTPLMGYAAKLLKDLRVLGNCLTFCINSSSIVLGALLYAAWRQIYALNENAWLASASTLGLLSIYGLLGSFIPRSLGLHKPIKALSMGAAMALALRWLLFPLLFMGSVAGNILLRLLRIRSPEDALSALDTEVQSRVMGRSGEPLSGLMRKIFSNIVAMQTLRVEDVLIPRNKLIYMDLNNSLEDSLRLAKRTGHTRFPLCRGGLDSCLGLVHIKDIFRSKEALNAVDLQKIKRPAVYLGLDEKLEEVLQKMISLRAHMALVHDEFGGTLGAITLERILEQMVGDIKDEFDIEESPVVRVDADTYRILGFAPLHEVARILAIPLDHEDVTTFGGLITATLGRIPKSGEHIELERLFVNIDQVDATRVVCVTVKVLPEEMSQED